MSLTPSTSRFIRNVSTITQRSLSSLTLSPSLHSTLSSCIGTLHSLFIIVWLFYRVYLIVCCIELMVAFVPFRANKVYIYLSNWILTDYHEGR